MASFADINVSQGSARCAWIFDIPLTSNLPRDVPVKKIQSVKKWQNYGHESVAPFSLAHPVDN